MKKFQVPSWAIVRLIGLATGAQRAQPPIRSETGHGICSKPFGVEVGSMIWNGEWIMRMNKRSLMLWSLAPFLFLWSFFTLKAENVNVSQYSRILVMPLVRLYVSMEQPWQVIIISTCRGADRCPMVNSARTLTLAWLVVYYEVYKWYWWVMSQELWHTFGVRQVQ